MQLSDITLNVRLRSPWEAVDLGFSMTQQYWRQIFPSWLMLLGTVMAIIWLILPNDAKTFAPLILWWLKPVYDRVLLYLYSQRLFALPLSMAQVFSALPQLMRHNRLLSALTWRRFSASRSFLLPIEQLENTKGVQRKQRQAVLLLQSHSQAIWLTIAGAHLEYVILLGIYALIVFLDPTDKALDFFWGAFQENFNDDLRYWSGLVYFIIYALAVALIEPLYVAAGFSLYLNRRTQLEAWDIELTFRDLGERLKTSTALLLITMFSSSVYLDSHFNLAYASDVTLDEPTANSHALPASESKQQIEAVMERPEFQTMHPVKRWQAKQQKTEKTQQPTELSESMQVLIATILKLILWSAAIIALVLAVVYRQQILNKLRPRRIQRQNTPPPDILFGMDIRPESLPEDISAECQRLWQNGSHREALSLLYRAALMRLTRHDQLAIHTSHTEGDILQVARTQLTGVRIAWLTAVTRAWQEQAYAHRQLPDQRVLPLFRDWQAFIQPAKPVEVTE